MVTRTESVKKQLDDLRLRRDESVAVKRHKFEIHGYYRGHDDDKLTIAYCVGHKPEREQWNVTPDDDRNNALAGWVEVDYPFDEIGSVRRFEENLPNLLYNYSRPSSYPQRSNYKSNLRCGGLVVSPLFRKRESSSAPWRVR